MRGVLDAPVRVEPVVGHYLQYLLERNPYLSARQVCTKTGMWSRPERQCSCQVAGGSAN